jgi:hypothetical protein
MPARRDHGEADDEDRRGQQEVELGPRRKAGGEAGEDQSAGWQAPAAFGACAVVVLGPRLVATASRGPGIEGDRDGGEEKEDPDDVVPRLPRLVRERRHAQSNRPESQGPRRNAIGAPNAPTGNQASHEPAKVEQRREEVPVERIHADRVNQLGVRRVKPGEELRRDEMQIPRVPALRKPRRKRPVVPRAVEPGHPCPELQLHFSAELHDRCRGDGQGDQGGDLGRSSGGWQRIRGVEDSLARSAPLIL